MKLNKLFCICSMALTVISTSVLTTGCGEDKDKAISLSVYAAAVPENSPTGVALKEMVNYINKESKGSLKATDYYDSALGDGASMVQGLTQGTIDIGVTGTAYFSGLVPEIEVFQLPFIFDNLQEARKAVDGEAGKIIIKKFESKGITGLCFWENGFRELSNNVREVSTPADMEGIKMRTLPSQVQVETWKTLGALPTSIDASELYTALQQGTVAAQENPLHEIVARKLYEVQKYISLTDHVYTPYFMGISTVTWNKLSQEQKDIIVKAALLGQKVQREQNEQTTEKSLKVIKDYGCTVVENPDKDAFKAKTADVWNIFRQEFGSELIDIIEKN